MTHGKSTAWLAAGAALLALWAAVPDLARPGVWLALTFLLYGGRAASMRAGLPRLAALLYAALLFANRATVPVRGPLYFVIVAAMTAIAVVPFVLDRWIGPSIPGGASTLVFPLALVAEHFLRTYLPSGPATWGSLAYTQYGNLPLMQLAAVTGLSGITFVVGWTASVASWAWARGFDRAATGRTVLGAAALLGAITLGAALRLAFAPPPAATIRAAAISFPAGLFTPGEMFRIADGRLPVSGDVAARLERLHDAFFERTEREAKAGARLVAWPEMNFLVRAEDESDALRRAQDLALREHVTLALGIGAVRAGDPKPFENKTVLVDSSGQVLYDYLKSRPVVGWEERVMRRGDGRLPVVTTDIGRVSSAICFDGDHPDLVRQAGRGGAELFVLPANDWPAVQRIHLEMAAFRAIENGTPMLRAASFGTSAVFDAYGRLLASADHVAGAPVLVADVPVGHVPTLYPFVGDVFAWLCVAGTAGVVLRAVMRKRAGARAIAARGGDPALAPPMAG
jgi:apolipoprotein N-acyltransferase